MKKSAILLICFIIFFFGCAGWTINGIPTEQFKQTGAKEIAQLAAGAALSIALHTAGHIAYLEASGKDWHMYGTSEICEEPLSHSEAGWFGRIGFLTQLAGGGIIKLYSSKGSWFATGYHAMTLAEITTYPAIHPKSDTIGDLGLIDRGSNAEIEWGIYTTAAILLLDLDAPK